MSVLGKLNLYQYLTNAGGSVAGTMINDCKVRRYYAEYLIEDIDNSKFKLSKKNGTGDTLILDKVIPLTQELVGFLGLYSGDGSKGSEKKTELGVLVTSISFSQREPNLVKFATKMFNLLFGNQIRFTFSVGEDSAYFFAGDGLEALKKYYGGKLPSPESLTSLQHKLNEADERYLKEVRPVNGNNEDHLAYYYQHKDAMEKILIEYKIEEFKKVNLVLRSNDKIVASMRRPFKKGAREPGGSSRSDELHIGGVNGFGEILLKIMQSIEETILSDFQVCKNNLVEWNQSPFSGSSIDTKNFFESNKFANIAGRKPVVVADGPQWLKGKWGIGREILLSKSFIISPALCFASGLYLAEGTTPKSIMFSMYKTKPSGLGFGFTSSEGASIDIILAVLKRIFPKDECISSWKIKVGSQYFPELVVIGLKYGMPILRGGKSGDGKLRTIEISSAIKQWGLDIVSSLNDFEDKFSHVEPTGAGVPRVDISASSSICKWFFSILMFSMFSESISDPSRDFYAS